LGRFGGRAAGDGGHRRGVGGSDAGEAPKPREVGPEGRVGDQPKGSGGLNQTYQPPPPEVGSWFPGQVQTHTHTHTHTHTDTRTHRERHTYTHRESAGDVNRRTS